MLALVADDGISSIAVAHLDRYAISIIFLCIGDILSGPPVDQVPPTDVMSWSSHPGDMILSGLYVNLSDSADSISDV